MPLKYTDTHPRVLLLLMFVHQKEAAHKEGETEL